MVERVRFELTVPVKARQSVGANVDTEPANMR
jgi:hypothetical protein